MKPLVAMIWQLFSLFIKRELCIGGVLLLILSLPCVFGYSLWSSVHLIGGRDVLDSEDFIVSNLLLPIGSLVYLLFCVTKWGGALTGILPKQIGARA